MESKLKSIFETEMKATEGPLLSRPWIESSFYKNWLAQTYYYVNHSSRLIMLAGSRFSHGHEKYHKRFMSYAKEEGGHEKLASRDLKNLGGDVFGIPEFYETKNLYMAQYYWIQNQNPMAFFGYILALEGLATHFGESILKKIEPTYGAKACSFLKVHAAEDINHIQQAFDLIKDMTKEEESLVIANFHQSLNQYMGMLSACQSTVQRHRAA